MSKIFGIVNITTDSFSDGGLYLDSKKAIEHALKLAEDGADIIDLGAASSNPDTTDVSVEEEIKRLKPVIKALKKQNIKISVDTFKPKVQRFCIDSGVDYINDIQGFPFPEFYEVLSKSDCGLVLMHSIQRLGVATKINTNPELKNSNITGMISVTKVKVTNDLKFAKVYVSILNSKNLKETAKGLFSIFGILKDLLFGVISGFKNTEKSSESLLTKFLRLTAGIGKLITGFRQFIKDNKIFEGFGKIVASITRLIVNLVGIVTDTIAKLLGNTVTIQKYNS